MIGKRLMLAVIAALGIGFGAAGAGQAQSYPDHAIKLVLPYTAGSPNGVFARLIATPLSEKLGQSVVVEAKPGGGTLIGTRDVIGAAPDGYTLMFSNTPTLAVAAAAMANAHYDPVKDLTPVALLGSTSLVLVIPPSIPAKTVAEFVAYAKARPGKLNFGYGQGTLPHLVGEIFQKETGTDLAGIPYKGGAPAVADMLGGRIHMNLGTIATLRPLIQAGKVTALAVTSTKRNPLLPEVPTMAEAGYPEVASVTHYGIFGPAHLPDAIVGKLNKAANEATNLPQVRQAEAQLGFEPATRTPQELAALLAAEVAKWTAAVKKTGFKL